VDLAEAQRLNGTHGITCITFFHLDNQSPPRLSTHDTINFETACLLKTRDLTARLLSKPAINFH
jgi:hypothetical protein